MTDDEVPAFVAALGLPGIVDAHVHFLPAPVQQAVWRWFDQLTPAWPVTYRLPADERLETLTALGVRHHTALAYAHRPGMLRFLNDHTAMVFTDPPYLSEFPGQLVERVAWLGDRILFGSDFPTIPHVFAAQVQGLAGLGFGDDWMRQVLWHNAAELFGLR